MTLNPFQKKYIRLLTARLFDRDIDLFSLRSISIQRKLAPGISLGSWLSFAALGLAGVTNPWLYLFPLGGSIAALFIDEESDRAAALLMPLITQRDEARRIGEKELLESQLVNLKEMLRGQEEWVRAQFSQAPQYAALPPAQPELNPSPATNATSDNAGDAPSGHWFDELLEYPLVLVFGAPGSGKTTTAAALVRKRVERGHRVVVCDPHRKFGAWKGLTIVGDGMDYEAIDGQLEWVASEIKRRYKRYSSEPDPKFEPLTIVCDEFTNWWTRCEHSAEFIDASISDMRKIDVCVIIISHMNTLKGMGGSSGVAKAIEASFIQVELLSRSHPETKKAAPTLEGWLRLPSKSRKERVPIRLEPWMDVSMDFTELNTPHLDSNQKIADDPPEADKLNALLSKNPFPKPGDSNYIQLMQQLFPEMTNEQQDAFLKQCRESGADSACSDDIVVSNLSASEDARPPSVSSPHTNPKACDSEACSGSELPVHDSYTYLANWSNMPEETLYRRIRQGYEDGLSASDIVKKRLGKTKPDDYRIGRATFIYLIRKFGSVDEIIKFKKYLGG